MHHRRGREPRAPALFARSRTVPVAFVVAAACLLGGLASGAGRAQNGSSGSIAIATNSSVRYVIDAWKTRIGRGSVPRTARV
jgi:hypothetical protein